METPIKIQHRSKPSEPFGREGQHGLVLRITPAYRTIPAQAYCKWEMVVGKDFPLPRVYYTWEKLTDLIQVLDD